MWIIFLSPCESFKKQRLFCEKFTSDFHGACSNYQYTRVGCKDVSLRQQDHVFATFSQTEHPFKSSEKVSGSLVERSWKYGFQVVKSKCKGHFHPHASESNFVGKHFLREAKLYAMLQLLQFLHVDHTSLEGILGLHSNQAFTLLETNIAMENPPLWWYLPGKMGVFRGYVSFREGKLFGRICKPINST